MDEILLFVLTSFVIGVLCALPTILVGQLLVAKGIVSKTSIIEEIAISLCAVVFARLVFPQIPLWLFVAIYLPIAPYRAHRDELWAYFLKRKKANKAE